mmetsp:Transcript_133927/g.232437  ORF Transcript_133927/g.232437 Transcript_133927/m.232437 type:complete len:287 (-) Transcript_133927:373-1233(-)
MLGKIHGQLVNLRVVETLQLLQSLHVPGCHQVDGNTLPPVPSTAANTMQVRFTVGGEVKVDDDTDVLDVDTSGQQIGGDQHTRATTTESCHNLLTLSLWHICVHERNSELLLIHLIGQPVHLPSGVTENHRLGDGYTVIQIHEGLQLVLLFDGNVELLNTLQSQSLLLDQNAPGVAHELGRQIQHVWRHSGREKCNLDVLGKELEDLVDLLGETLRQHFISFVQNQNLEGLSPQRTSLDDVENATRSTDSNNNARVELADIIDNASTSDESRAESGIAVSKEISDV